MASQPFEFKGKRMKLLDRLCTWTQLMQDGDTCWFYSTKRLANASGHQFDDPRARERYNLVSRFRKTQSKLDSAVLIAATLLAKNVMPEKAYTSAIGVLLAQRGISKAYKLTPSIIQKMIDYTSPQGETLPRQLKDLKNDAKIIQEYVERYKKYNLGQIQNSNPETIEAIALWLKARNPYQSQLLECACDTADALSRLDSAEFSDREQYWSVEPKKLVVQQQSSLATAASPFSGLAASNPSVIILGAGPASTSGASASQRELTVAEKQERRRQALLDFNHKINRETLAVFGMDNTTFRTAEELRDRLKECGPLIMSGYYGQRFYTVPAHLLKDQDGKNQTIGTRQLLGWKAGEARGADSFNPLIEHQITIIGIKYNPAAPNRSLVMFIDSNDSSIPGEQRKAYAISFERLSKNRSTKYRDCVTAYYSTAERSPVSVYEKEIQAGGSKPVNTLLTYSAIAAIGLGAVACITRTVMKPKV